jgi:hypothetical protein
VLSVEARVNLPDRSCLTSEFGSQVKTYLKDFQPRGTMGAVTKEFGTLKGIVIRGSETHRVISEGHEMVTYVIPWEVIKKRISLFSGTTPSICTLLKTRFSADGKRVLDGE